MEAASRLLLTVEDSLMGTTQVRKGSDSVGVERCSRQIACPRRMTGSGCQPHREMGLWSEAERLIHVSLE